MMNELEQLKEDICMESFGRSRNLALAAGQCVKCGTYDLNFRDEPSQREYKLTVWCQSCQDEFFGVEEEPEVGQGSHAIPGFFISPESLDGLEE
jgi:hypothetical protein